MPQIDLRLGQGDGDGAFSDLVQGKRLIVQDSDQAILHIAGLANGMKSGLPSVAFLVDVPGTNDILFFETSLKLFLATAQALRARYGEQINGITDRSSQQDGD
jgi:hypothetical protein